MARDFARGRPARGLPRRQHLRVLARRRDPRLGHGRADLRQGGARSRELRRGRVRRGRARDRHRREGRRRRPALPGAAFAATRWSGSTATRPTCSRSSTALATSSRGELEITDVNRAYAQRGELTVREVEGWWEDARQALAAPRRRRPADRRDGREQVIPGLQRIPLRKFEDERGWFMELRPRQRAAARDRADERLLLAPRRDPRPPLPRARPGRPLRLPPGDGARRRARPRSGETHCEDIGDENPVALYIPGRHAHGFEALTDLLFVYHVTEEYDPADPDEHGIAWDDPRVVDLWSQRSPILSPRDTAAAS